MTRSIRSCLHREQPREDHQRERNPEERLERGAGDRQGLDGEQQEQRGQQDPEPVPVQNPGQAREHLLCALLHRDRYRSSIPCPIRLLSRSLPACDHRAIWSTAAAIVRRSASSSPAGIATP